MEIIEWFAVLLGRIISLSRKIISELVKKNSLLFDPLSRRSFVLSEEASKSSQTKDTTHSKPEPRRGLKSEKRNLPYWFREGRFEVKPNWTKN